MRAIQMGIRSERLGDADLTPRLETDASHRSRIHWQFEPLAFPANLAARTARRRLRQA
jgi:hypothetical protein